MMKWLSAYAGAIIATACALFAVLCGAWEGGKHQAARELQETQLIVNHVANALGAHVKTHTFLGTYLGLPRYVVTLADERKIVLSFDGRHISMFGVYDARTGEDILAQAAAQQGAIPPAALSGMQAVRQSTPHLAELPVPQNNADNSPAPLASPAPPVQEFTAADFAVLAAAPGELLFPDKQSLPVKMAIYYWAECPSCTILYDFLQKHRESVGFQVKFIPVAGSEKLDRSALSSLGAMELPPDEKKKLLAALNAATDILGTRTGGLKVPTLAWQERDGSVRLAGLKQSEFGVLLDRLNNELRQE